jgi:hypothetical protein
MILQRERGTEQRYDTVAHHLIDRPLLAVHCLDHFLEYKIEHGPGFFWVTICKQFHSIL